MAFSRGEKRGKIATGGKIGSLNRLSVNPAGWIVAASLHPINTLGKRNSRQAPAGGLLSNDLNNKVAAASACVKINNNDLLPGAERQRALDNGDRQRRSLDLPA